MTDWDPERKFTKAQIMEFKKNHKIESISDSAAEFLMTKQKEDPAFFNRKINELRHMETLNIIRDLENKSRDMKENLQKRRRK